MGSNLGESCSKGFTLFRLLWGRGAIPFICGGRLHLISHRWCRREETMERAFHGKEKKKGEVHVLLALGVKGRRWSN